MWFNLSWFPHELRTDTVILSDGTTLSVQRFIEQDMQYTQCDIEAMLAEEDKLLRSILPLHRQLQEQSQIEVSVTPYGHPILPLLDEGVLARSGRYGYQVEDLNVLHQLYQAPNPGGEGAVSVLFRNRQLSDAIGFHDQSFPDPQQAAQSFIAAVKELARELQGEQDFLLSVILDGENAWGSYHADGRPFLDALYGTLTADPETKTVSVSEYTDGTADRRLPPHPRHRAGAGV